MFILSSLNNLQKALPIPSTSDETVLNLRTHLVPGLGRYRSQLDKYLEVYSRFSDPWYQSSTSTLAQTKSDRVHRDRIHPRNPANSKMLVIALPKREHISPPELSSSLSHRMEGSPTSTFRGPFSASYSPAVDAWLSTAGCTEVSSSRRHAGLVDLHPASLQLSCSPAGRRPIYLPTYTHGQAKDPVA